MSTGGTNDRNKPPLPQQPLVTSPSGGSSSPSSSGPQPLKEDPSHVVANAETALAESRTIDKNTKEAAQAAIEAGKKANFKPTPENISEFDQAIENLKNTFTPSSNYKNEGEALADLILKALTALMLPFELATADKDLKGKLQQTFNNLKSKLKGEKAEEALVSMTPPSAQPAETATAETTANLNQDNLADLMPEEGTDIDEGFSDAEDLEGSEEPVDAVNAAMSPSSRIVTPMMEAAKDEANAEPVIHSISGNLKSLLKALEKDPQKAEWGIKDFKTTKSGVKLELENGSKMYAKENQTGGLTYSLKRGMKPKERQTAIEKACQMSVDLASHGTTITISPKLSEAQQKAVYEAIQKAMEKPENQAKGLKIVGYEPATEVLSTRPASRQGL